MKTTKWLILISLMLIFMMIFIGCGSKTPAENPEATTPAQTTTPEVTPAPVTPPESSKVVTGVCDPWPPFIDPEAEGQGFSIEVVTAAFKESGYEFKLEIMPWARAEEGVKSGEYDVLPNTWFTDARTAYLLYSDAYAVNEVRFIKRVGDPFEYDGLESLAGKNIGIINGYGYGDAFSNDPGFTRVPVTNLIQNIQSLIAERIDLTLEDKIVASAMIMSSDPTLLEQIEFTENSLSANELHVTSGLANPRSKEIIDAFNAGLKAIKENGIYDAISAKYGIK